jgi:prolyl oligopeptidase
MKKISLAALLLVLRAPAFADPFRWLEEIDSSRALAWVEARDAKTLADLKSDPRFELVEADARAVVLATDRIPAPELRGRWIYNFWQDRKSVRGVWRRATPDEYRRLKPRWETVLDLDALSRKEKENWVWKGADCLQPDQDRCLLTLSRGGKDAAVVREFDASNKQFVAGGFFLAEAKSDVAWLDADELLVGTDFGPGTLTKSGYPRILKLWKRGTPLSSARTLYEGRAEDVSVSPWVARRPDGQIALINESLTFFTSRRFTVKDGALTELPLPQSAELRGYFDGRLFLSLRDPYGTIPAGALVAWPIGAKDASALETVWTPNARQSLQSVATTRDGLYLAVLEDVQGAMLRARRDGRFWSVERLPFPMGSSLGFAAADDFSSLLLVSEESFLQPTSIAASNGETWRRQPARFDASGLSSEQRWATSADGTRVPYFLVRRASAPFDGSTPTLLYGYGGFEVSLAPSYLATVGRVWLARGGAYAVANIRGGGEFGPRWHEAALKENRQRAFDDFEAVAEDLEKTRETSPAKLAIMGGSNGGLLVATVLTQKPELLGAVVCDVPITDMLRYEKLGAGSSWVGEYGSADDPATASVLRGYSPYQNVRPGVRYPKTLIYSSTKDDRVHPGHARKLAARLEEVGAPVAYYENVEGGHSAAANLGQRVERYAIEYTFLLRALF